MDLLELGFVEDTRAWPNNEVKNEFHIYIKGQLIVKQNQEGFSYGVISEPKVFKPRNVLWNENTIMINKKPTIKSIYQLDLIINGEGYIEKRVFDYKPPTQEEVAGWFEYA